MDVGKTLHRVDGPAADSWGGAIGWMVDGKLHRENGPAQIINGKERYWIRGVQLDKKIFNDIKNGKNLAFYMLSSNEAERWFATKREKELNQL